MKVFGKKLGFVLLLLGFEIAGGSTAFALTEIGTLSFASGNSDCRGFVLQRLSSSFGSEYDFPLDDDEICIQMTGVDPVLVKTLADLTSDEFSEQRQIASLTGYYNQGSFRVREVKHLICSGTCECGPQPLAYCAVRRDELGCEQRCERMSW